MNSQDLHNLQEAYMEVYELDEDGWQPPTQKKADKMMKQASKLHRTASERGEPGNPEAEKKHTQASKIYFMSRRMSDKAKERDNEAKRKEFVKEDLYDIILSHLLDEGYAETPQAAEVIMVNMSEDWRESICEGYVPLRTSDEHYDDEGFPTTTRSWSNKMTDARIGVGKVKDRSRRNSGDPIGNLTKGVSAKKRLDAMKKVDDEPESVRAKRSQAKAAANRQLGTNRRSLQTSLDREHLTKSLKSS